MFESFTAIARRIDSVAPASSLRELARLHGVDPDRASFRAIWKRHNGPASQSARFLFFNTYLMDARDLDLSDGTKPAVEARARELGAYLRDSIDVAALCEVWRDRERRRILAAWPDPPPHVHETARTMLRSAGLLTLSQRMPIERGGSLTFRAEAGSDRAAAKGVLHAILDPGLGTSRVSVYNTHLQAGKNPEIRLRQVVELAAFVARTRRPQDHALIVGDFNLDAYDRSTYPVDSALEVDAHAHVRGPIRRVLERVLGDVPDPIRRAVLEQVVDGEPTGVRVTRKTPYRLLTDVLSVLGFRDLWIERNGTPGYTTRLLHGTWSALVCPSDRADPTLCSDEVQDVEALRDYADARSGDVKKKGPPRRIDYVFASAPAGPSTINVDYTRPRRTRLTRADDAPHRDKIAFLSDHIGITTTLVISPT